MSQRAFFHSGDLGDIVAALPSIRQLGGGGVAIGNGFCRESMRGPRFEAILPLLAQQPYVSSVAWTETLPSGAHDLSMFRNDHRKGESLAHWQARHLGINDLDTNPWLTKRPNETYRGRVIFARSQRYANGFYPWFALLKRYPDAVFVGSPTEHVAFESEFRCKVEYVPTRDLQALASVIAAAKLFCGNQSCPWWIACGLGITTFQETWAHDSNSVIKRHNAHYMTAPVFDLGKLPE